MPESFRKLQKQRLKHLGDNQDMVNVLALVLQHDERKVEQGHYHCTDQWQPF
ncbi:hypothetical protein [Candidatus Vondammii sp. HM_W22]|uniref:hypothetical protein n=1 Tax=Candidatus Vondammii sp. HM_W22 TaxID=2687299 RepID=UPI001F1466C6|nr:hypothetical protein [Candidatus Vondammii sp. HM_W22]